MRNLTHHSVTVSVSDNEVTLVPELRPARVVESRTDAGTVSYAGLAVPVVVVRPGEVVGLPPETPGVGLVVSRAVALAMPARADLFVPFDVVRDKVGRVVACRALARLRPVGGV